MKVILTLMLGCMLSCMLYAQESTGERPFSFTNDVGATTRFTKVLPRLDVATLRASNAARQRSGVPLQCGKLIPVNFTTQNSGEWKTLSNGDRLWQLVIEVPEALATSLYYKDFELPEGARLFVYSKDKAHHIGAFTAKNNQSHRLFASELVNGGACVVEYYEPSRVKGLGKFTISDVNHVFYLPGFVAQNISGRTKINESGSCNVNVNCPEGNNYQNQKRAVARYVGREGTGAFLCTGTLINNAPQQNKQYFLTADHCGGSASAADFNQWIFYFNYEAPGCSNPSSASLTQTVTGCVQRARSGNKGNGDSDFQLVEITPAIPSAYNVYYAGWDARNAPSASGVCIHHPAGDIKKISTYTAPLADDNGHHWKVYWVQTQTNWGITEGGSSGSGLFNSAGQLVGDLTGGASACGVSAADAWDVYGKVSYSWTSNGTAANRQLKPWLDPNNTGVLTLTGRNAGSAGSAPVATITAPANNASFTSGTSITISATATDADGNGTITGVGFYDGATLLGTDNTSPYSYTWTNASVGSHQLTARATDNTSLTGTSSIVNVTITTVAGNDITNAPGSISAQYTDSPTGEDVAKLIDNNSNSKYLTFHNAGWVQFQAGSPYVVTSYAITSANDAAERDPLNWTFQGSTTGTTWVTLDTRSNEDFPNRLQRKAYTFSNTTAYSYYRLNLTNNSGTILQVAEWEIYGTASSVATIYQHCSYGGYAIALTPGTYTLSALQAKGMANNDVSSVRVSAGYKIVFFDQDNYGGTSLEKTADDDCLVNENFNDLTTSIRVEQASGGDWSNFPLPTIVFQDLSPTSAGSVTFHRAIPDPVATMRNSILPMLQKIYSSPNDNVRTFTKLTLIIEDYDGVAEAWGGAGERNIRVSTRHIQNVFNQSNNDATVRTEIQGILSHEATHTAQHEPKNAGTYTPGTEFYGFIEGLADYVRISLALHPTRSPQSGGNWKDGYTTSGFFLNWIVNNKGDRDFAIKFNRTAGSYTTWSWDIACRDILGIGVQTLWNEYQTWITTQKTSILAPYAMGSSTSDCKPNETSLKSSESLQPLQAFPNPARGSIDITLRTAEPNDRTEVQFISGTFTKKSHIVGTGGTINIEDLPAGIYVMIVHDKKGNSHKQRIVVVK